MQSIRYTFSLTILVAFLFLFNSCANSKMAKFMNAHQNSLQQAISGNLSAEEKLDIVATSLVNVLNESISYGNPKNTVKHINRYSKVNETALNTITKDLEGWMSNMSTAEKVMVVGKIAQKPYTKELINLVPKFERKVNRKIQTFKIASKIFGAVTPKLF